MRPRSERFPLSRCRCGVQHARMQAALESSGDLLAKLHHMEEGWWVSCTRCCANARGFEEGLYKPKQTSSHHPSRSPTGRNAAAPTWATKWLLLKHLPRAASEVRAPRRQRRRRRCRRRGRRALPPPLRRGNAGSTRDSSSCARALPARTLRASAAPRTRFAPRRRRSLRQGLRAEGISVRPDARLPRHCKHD